MKKRGKNHTHTHKEQYSKTIVSYLHHLYNRHSLTMVTGKGKSRIWWIYSSLPKLGIWKSPTTFNRERCTHLTSAYTLSPFNLEQTSNEANSEFPNKNQMTQITTYFKPQMRTVTHSQNLEWRNLGKGEIQNPARGKSH